MESVSSVWCASVRRIWTATVSKCVSRDPLEEPEPVAMALLRGEFTEAQSVIEDLKVLYHTAGAQYS